MSAPETYYDVAMQRLDRQAAPIDVLDAKARATLAAASALVPIFGALLARKGRALCSVGPVCSSVRRLSRDARARHEGDMGI
jgi:hypothetical protein